ncbi:MAG: MFS transporter TsgA [Woeseiaceae bacterium]
MKLDLSANHVRITLSSFLAYFVMSSVISPLGIVTQPIADHYGIEVTTATAIFSYLTTGILGGTFLAMFVYSVLSLRAVTMLASLILIASMLSAWLIDLFSLLPILLALIGVTSGLLLSAAIVVLTHSYSERARAPALLVTDSFYSGAGVISGWTSGLLIERGYHWGSTYALAIAATTLLLIIVLVSRYPSGKSEAPGRGTSDSQESWPPGVFVVAAALFVYILSFVFIYSWVPNYAAEAMQSSPEQGGTLVSRFFLGLFVGQVAMFALVFKIDIRWLISGTACLAALASCGLWLAGDYKALLLWMFALGFLSGGLLKTLITYGTMMVSNPSPRLVGFFIFSPAFGTSLAPAVSALIVEAWGTRAILIALTAGYTMVAGLVLVAVALKRSSMRVATEAG